jgi:hypothetical protein
MGMAANLLFLIPSEIFVYIELYKEVTAIWRYAEKSMTCCISPSGIHKDDFSGISTWQKKYFYIINQLTHKNLIKRFL